MKNIINKLNFIASVLLIVMITSCDSILDQDETDFGKGPVLAQFETPVTEVNIVKTVDNEPVEYEFNLTYFGGRGVALDNDVTVTIAASADSEAKEGVEFELNTKTFTIPAGKTTSTGSLTILTAGLIPFDFKDIVLEIVDSSESISESNTITITIKALGADSLAGTYEVIDGDYWRIGVNNGWSQIGATRVIEALSETTYKHPDFFGLFSGEFYFTVNNNVVEVLKTNPITGEVMLQGTAPFLTCNANSDLLTNVPCGSDSNRVERATDRTDIIYLTYGYNTIGSGPREFYEVLQRIE